MENKFDKTVEDFRLLKGVSKKTAERIVIDLVNNSENIKNIQASLTTIKNDLGECPTCFYLTIDKICPICVNPDRDQNLIAVVAEITDAKVIEDSQTYNGVYAILKGEINLNKNITPDKLKIEELFARTKPGKTELILALNSTFNGELTANYIRDIARKEKVNYSRLARGIPLGGVLDYVDQKTLSEAIKNRKKDD